MKGYNVAYRLVPDLTSAALEDGNKNNNNNSNNNSHNLNTLHSTLQLTPSATLINKRNGQATSIAPTADSIADLQNNNNKNQNFIVKSIESSDQDKERFVLLGLRKHSKYEIKVQAYNSGRFEWR